jgi:hypothetical protein
VAGWEDQTPGRRRARHPDLMRVLGFLLWAYVFYSYNFTADLFGSTPARWGYVGQGYGGMILALCVVLACRDWLARFFYAWIAFEYFLMGTCGSMRLYQLAPWAVNPYEGLCGRPFDVNLYKFGLFMLALSALLLSRRWNKK